MLEAYYTQQQLGIPDSTLRDWERVRKFPPRIKIGGRRVVWLRTEVDRWFQDQHKAAAGSTRRKLIQS